MKKRDLTELKIKICSLAEEAKIIRREEGRFPSDSNKRFRLRNHRIMVVRREARAAQLAYGFLRGMPYNKMEAKTHDEPLTTVFAALKRNVVKFGTCEWQDSKFTADMLDLWLAGKLEASIEPEESKETKATENRFFSRLTALFA